MAKVTTFFGNLSGNPTTHEYPECPYSNKEEPPMCNHPKRKRVFLFCSTQHLEPKECPFEEV